MRRHQRSLAPGDQREDQARAGYDKGWFKDNYAGTRQEMAETTEGDIKSQA